MKLLVLLLAAACMLLAQHQHTGAPPSEKPVALYPGLGTWRHPIAAANAEAQKFFDQGLVLLYGFNRYEALRSFRRVLELDPNAAMAHWGVSMALGPYVNMDMDPDIHLKEACDASKAGLALKDVSTAERAWLTASTARCPDFSDPSRYITAMRGLAAQFPDDPDAQTLYAEALMLPVRWRWYKQDGTPNDGTAEAERVLEQVLRRYPQHPGANHYYIHAVESSPTPERAVPSAQRLMGIVPAAGHMVHMPGHIWLVLGDYDTAVDVNERAVAVDRKYFDQTGVTGSYYPYYLHNLQFILYARSMQGRVADTKKAGEEMAAALKPMAEIMPEMAEVFGGVITMADLRTQRWDAVLAMLKPGSHNPLSLAMWHYSRSLAQAGKRLTSDAATERAEFEKLRKTIDSNVPWGNNRITDVMELASVSLSARLQQSPKAAVPLWEKAVAIQDALVYDEPPAWYYPVRESLGAALLQSGDAAQAETVFREGLRRSPNNGRMLFGLMQALKAQGKNDSAAWVQKEFDRAWQKADLQLELSGL